MALAPINPTNLTPPRVALIDERSGAISREWYRFFLSLLTATETTTSVADSTPDTQSFAATLQQIVGTIQNEMQSAPEADVSGIQAQLDDLQQLVGVQPPAAQGSVSSVDASGGATGLVFTGGPITTSGTLTLGGTLGVGYGGTGTTTAFTAGSVVFAGASGVYSQDNANLFWDDANNRLGLGTLAPVSLLHVDGDIGTIARFGASGALVLRSAAGTQASPTQIVTSTTLGIVVGRGYDGAAYRDVGNMGFVSDGTISSTSSPGYIQFSTTPSGSTTAVERARVDSSGNVGIGTVAPNASAILDVQSTTKGFRLPNMTTTQKNAISSPAAGLMVFDTTLSKACVYSGAAWETITSL